MLFVGLQCHASLYMFPNHVNMIIYILTFRCGSKKSCVAMKKKCKEDEVNVKATYLFERPRSQGTSLPLSLLHPLFIVDSILTQVGHLFVFILHEYFQ